MKTKTIFRGIAPFRMFRTLSIETIGDQEEHVLLEGPFGGRVMARIVNGLRGDPLEVGGQRMLAVTREPPNGRAEILNQLHPDPRIGRVSLGILAAHGDDPMAILASHMEWARYGSVGSADIRFRKASGRIQVYCEDGNFLLDARLPDIDVKGDVITMNSPTHCIPETVAAAAGGMPLDDVIAHPALMGLGIVVDSMTAGGDLDPMTIITRSDPVRVARAIALAADRAA